MMTKRTLTFFVGLLVLSAWLAVVPAFGQRGQGQQMPYNRTYDPSTEDTVRGTVARVELLPGRRGTGVHLVLETEDGTLPVHLGPSWYITNQNPQITEGDEVEVTGSRITYQGAPALVARVVRRGDLALQLRDEAGFPVWRGWRRGGMGMQGQAGMRDQGQQRRGVMSAGGAPMYDAGTEQTVQGTVARVERIPMRGTNEGIRLLLDTGGELLPIHLGPSWFIDEQDLEIEQGDEIEVMGSRINVGGELTLIAARVQHDGQVLVLRDEQGYPVWSGR